MHSLNRSDENKVGRSRWASVFQLTGDVHYFDSDQFFAFIIEDDSIVEFALAVSRILFFFETDVKRVHIILVVKPQFARRETDSPAARGSQQFFFSWSD